MLTAGNVRIKVGSIDGVGTALVTPCSPALTDPIVPGGKVTCTISQETTQGDYQAGQMTIAAQATGVDAFGQQELPGTVSPVAPADRLVDLVQAPSMKTGIAYKLVNKDNAGKLMVVCCLPMLQQGVKALITY